MELVLDMLVGWHAEVDEQVHERDDRSHVVQPMPLSLRQSENRVTQRVRRMVQEAGHHCKPAAPQLKPPSPPAEEHECWNGAQVGEGSDEHHEPTRCGGVPVAPINKDPELHGQSVRSPYSCLLYTSDAADEEDSVDLGGRRIIKKKKNSYNEYLEKAWELIN
eukprot:TRINITY_DN19735_c0_g1_i4.p2 TRINITY_DN19735_c0_g1~~TRINITY_DN19735_c0_g1_i4.p2  ORF type:complete len:163 (+),score=32.23 TRINITY_DN19735_c0_g1_i4:762-1250(+)